MKRVTLLGSILAATLVFAAWVSGQEDEELIEGMLTIRAHDSGAAPYGIASGVLTSTNTGLNIGGLQQGALPKALPEGEGLLVDERYDIYFEFKLRPAGRDKLKLHHARIRYEVACNTAIEYADGYVRDTLHDADVLEWEDGKWTHIPEHWKPEGHPRMDVTLNRDTNRFEMDFVAVHPLTVSGQSIWKTDLSEIRLEAEDGIYRYHADSPFLNMQASGDAGELMRKMREFFDSLSAIFEVDTRQELTFAHELEGAYTEEDGLLLGMDTFRILTGAQVGVFVSTGLFTPLLENVDKAWLPEPGESVDVRARIRGNKAPALKWRYTLYEVTNEKGQCTNCPIDQGDDPDEPDLEFDVSGSPFEEPKKTGEREWQIETREPEHKVSVKVVATDSGAWGRLRAQVLAGDEWINVPVEVAAEGGEDSITIPFDEKGGSNKIADAWEQQEGLEPGADRRADEDEEPESYHAGDGLTAYEEYRGFHMMGNLVRTKPKQKDLFLHAAEKGLQGDIRKAVAPTGLGVNLIEADEMVDISKRVINDNSGNDYRITEQHGLYITTWNLGGSTLGRACSDATDCECIAHESQLEENAFPCDRTRIPSKCRRTSSRKNTGDPWPTGNGTPKDTGLVAVDTKAYAEANRRSRLIRLGHEIMHGVSVDHHQSNDNDFNLCRKGSGPEAYVQRTDDVCECLQRGEAYEFSFGKHGLGSGDQKCIMNNGSAATNDDTLIGEPPAMWTLRSTLPRFRTDGPQVGYLCISGAGTGFNANDQQAGDAELVAGGLRMGNCKEQIKVCDKAH